MSNTVEHSKINKSRTDTVGASSENVNSTIADGKMPSPDDKVNGKETLQEDGLDNDDVLEEDDTSYVIEDLRDKEDNTEKRRRRSTGSRNSRRSANSSQSSKFDNPLRDILGSMLDQPDTSLHVWQEDPLSLNALRELPVSELVERVISIGSSKSSLLYVGDDPLLEFRAPTGDQLGTSVTLVVY
ncbi:hypothetical protein FOL47_002688 [Perkinsus chesapeaki]|uniref:Uncharacterized protein n=1 Tax=Perkinsus chesapeaki TaxID=330153 RepID=A0A7J6KQV4_PERCH|nr:hypothetical protein FOL47_002688 [Perkinsus chesapeaki]